MGFFSRVLSPLYLSAEREPTPPTRFEIIARYHAGIGDGVEMLATQAANKVLRHCRIGVVTPKPKANA